MLIQVQQAGKRDWQFLDIICQSFLLVSCSSFLFFRPWCVFYNILLHKNFVLFIKDVQQKYLSIGYLPCVGSKFSVHKVLELCYLMMGYVMGFTESWRVEGHCVISIVGFEQTTVVVYHVTLPHLPLHVERSHL